MYPWTTPPTSWPAPPQPTNASSTWPQSSQTAHLFGHPSALHPTWSSSASIMPSTSTPTSLPFTSVSPAPHAVPGPQLVPTMPSPLASEPTMVHNRSFDFPISFGTHRSTCLAFSSDFISYVDSTTYIDYATDTFAKFSLPTPSHSTSITNGRIDGLSR